MSMKRGARAPDLAFSARVDAMFARRSGLQRKHALTGLLMHYAEDVPLGLVLEWLMAHRSVFPGIRIEVTANPQAGSSHEPQAPAPAA